MISPITPPAPAGAIAPQRVLFWLLALVLVVTAVRLWVVWSTPLQLGPDESQYWAWGRTLDWGYFSKPPLVGWVGGLAPLLGGDSAFGARWPSAIAHALGTLGIYAFTRRLGSQQAALLAAVLYIMAPGVWLSSFLLATDALMIPLAVWGLYAVQRLRETQPDAASAPPAPRRAAIGWAVVAGLLFGLATLGKYAALYVPGALVLGALLDRPLRRALLGWPGVALASALLLVLAPNLVWNAMQGGATIRHTVGNANLDGPGAGFNLDEPISWLAEQFGVFGLIAWPVGLLVCLWALVRPGHPMRAYAFTVLVPVLVVLAVAAASRANANWAAVALAGLAPAAALALDAALRGRVRGALARAALAFALAVQTLMAAAGAAAFVSPPLADRIGLTAALSDLRAWPETVEAVTARGRELGATGIVADNRNLYHGLHFTGRQLLRTADEPMARTAQDARLELRGWRGWDGALNHAEGVGGLSPGTPGVWLMASERTGYDRFFREDFARVEPVGEVVISLGPGRDRRIRLFLVEGVRPVTRTRAELAQP
jgi:4-amino-4-deoxy-L-arabinose transferase-like glycosyltransferase